jgi:hypothetical protein
MRGSDAVNTPDSFTGGEPVHPVAKPAVVETRERLEREISASAEPHQHAPAPVQPQTQHAPVEETKSREPRRGLSLFGRRKSAPAEHKAPSQPERPSVVRPVEAASRPTQPSGDLFGEGSRRERAGNPGLPASPSQLGDTANTLKTRRSVHSGRRVFRFSAGFVTRCNNPLIAGCNPARSVQGEGYSLLSIFDAAGCWMTNNWIGPAS